MGTVGSVCQKFAAPGRPIGRPGAAQSTKIVSPMHWTLENELIQMSGQSSLDRALLKLGILPTAAKSYELRAEAGWVRGGAETYTLRFSVRYGAMCEVQDDYIVKACISTDFSRSLTDTVAEWLRRRRLLQEHNIGTPRLIGVHGATIVEEFIPWPFRDCFISSTERQERGLELLIGFAEVLNSLGFRPVDAFSDLRSRGTDLVAIDFGQDLGEPDLDVEDISRLWPMLVDASHRWGFSATSHEWDRLRRAFEKKQYVSPE